MAEALPFLVPAAPEAYRVERGARREHDLGRVRRIGEEQESVAGVRALEQRFDLAGGGDDDDRNLGRRRPGPAKEVYRARARPGEKNVGRPRGEATEGVVLGERGFHATYWVEVTMKGLGQAAVGA